MEIYYTEKVTTWKQNLEFYFYTGYNKTTLKIEGKDWYSEIEVEGVYKYEKVLKVAQEKLNQRYGEKEANSIIEEFVNSYKAYDSKAFGIFDLLKDERTIIEYLLDLLKLRKVN